MPNAISVREKAARLLEEKPPVLVEVLFPHMGTSSDWFLCEEAAELDIILDRLGPGAEIHVSSVWNLQDATGGVVLRK